MTDLWRFMSVRPTINTRGQRISTFECNGSVPASQKLRSGGDDVRDDPKLSRTSQGVPRAANGACGGHLDLPPEISKLGFVKILWIHPQPFSKGIPLKIDTGKK